MTVTAQQAGTEPGGSAGTLATWVADVRMGDAAQETAHGECRDGPAADR